MTICDLSSFYCDKGGGVTTFHRARIDWFARQSRHRYVLISPGPRREVRQVAPSVWLVHIHGLRASRDQDRYRLLTDFRGVRDAVERFAPDVLETHDPWFSLPIGLMLRFRGPYRGLLTTYCHSDPIQTYLHPRLARWTPRAAAAPALRFERWADRQLHRQHAACHAVFAASDTMLQRLAEVGVTRAARAAFGVDPDLLRLRRRWPPERRSILYAGRLDEDKEFGLVLDILPRLLERPGVRVTVAGAGKHAGRAAAIAHPRFRYLGHLTDRGAMRTLYATHDVLLAPGRYETFGLSALEGAAAGLVVVGPSAGGTGELLRQCGSPLAHAAGDAGAFLDAVIAAIEGEHRVLVERGRAIAARFGTWSDAVARHVAFYESLAGAAPEPSRSSASPVRTSVPVRM
jgi:alpha-1,6-mannosyltransferase